MLCVTPRRRPLLLTRLVLWATAITFAVVASLAASHVHVVPGDDDPCAVCAAFTGKVHAAGPHGDASRRFVVVHLVVAALPQSQRVGVSPTLPPPSCGPPVVA
jgi:hypothetical protein